LPDEPGLLRGSLFQDRFCVFDGDLIAVTTAGNVWRIKADGTSTRIAEIGTHLEGLTTVPDDRGKYGPWAGKILVGAEEEGCLYTVDKDGEYLCWDLGIYPEDIDLIEKNENYFVISYGDKVLMGAKYQDFQDKIGDFIILQESPGLMYYVRWDPTRRQFQKTLMAQVSQWEQATFSPSGILEVPGIHDAPPLNTCEPPAGTFQADPAWSPLLIASATRSCNSVTTGMTFFEQSFNLHNLPGTTAVLSSTPDGLNPIWVNDGLTMLTNEGVFYYDFAPSCGAAQSCGPADVTSILAPGDDILTIRLYNICSPCIGNSDIYLVLGR
jgi:hypothetical protein